MEIQVLEMKVKCRVPRYETDEYIERFRSGERLLRLPEGLLCKDAFDTGDLSDPETATICVAMGR